MSLAFPRVLLLGLAALPLAACVVEREPRPRPVYVRPAPPPPVYARPAPPPAVIIRP